ncbi:MAG: glycosyltransferase [Clostridia bacterium]|nr:glycosyltransferase [Clostridia bacterium]
MRVLHVISDENIGGAGVLLSNLLSELDPSRVHSTVALPAGSLLRERIAAQGVPVLPLMHASDRLSATAMHELCRCIRQSRAQLVHANAALSARVAGRICGIPVVHTRHCCYPLDGIWRLPPVRFAGGVCNRVLSDRVIATADAAAKNLCALGIPQKKITVIINGSKPIREVAEKELEDARRALKIEKDDFCVGICARLEACKGHDTFLRAACLLRERAPKIRFRFLVVGTGTRGAELERLSHRLGIADAVRFTGFVTDMAPIYRLLRVNVNCSSGTETSCLALSEGMSAGVPCVVSDYGGNRAMIGDGAAGLLFPVGDFEALAAHVLRIATNPDIEVSMRRAARARYEQNYTARRMAEETTALYERMVKI